MPEPYEITKQQLYVLVVACIVLAILFTALGVVIGNSYKLPESFPSPRKLAGDVVVFNDKIQLPEEMKELTRTSNDSSTKPHVPDEGRIFYKKLGKTDSWFNTPAHPAVGLVTALNRPVVGEKRNLGTAFGDAGIKGIFIEEKMMPAINVVYEELKKMDVIAGLDTADEAAEDLARTAIHEYAHYVDYIVGEEYKGGWWGKTPLEGLAVALTGRPIPSGSELSSEMLADMAWEALKKVDPESARKMAERMKREANELRSTDVGEILDELRKLKDKIYEFFIVCLFFEKFKYGALDAFGFVKGRYKGFCVAIRFCL